MVGETGGNLDGETNSAFLGVGFISKYYADGGRAWTKLISSTAASSADAVAVDDAGIAYVAGTTYASLENGDQFVSQKAYVATYNSSGAGDRVQHLGNTDVGSIFVNAISVSEKANVLAFVGCTWAMIEGATFEGDQQGSSAYVAKYSLGGSLSWVKQFGVAIASDDEATGVALDSAGNVFVAHSSPGTRCTSGAQPAGAVRAFKFNPDGTVAFANPFAARFDLDGGRTWVRQFGSPQDNVSLALAIDSLGAIILGGTTKGALDGLAPMGAEDGFLMKLDSQGNRQ